MAMAVRYQPLLGSCDDDPDADTLEYHGQTQKFGPGLGPEQRHHDEGCVSPLSPASVSTCPSTTASAAGMASPLPSPTPSNYLTLAEQTFTPLSMDGSDFCFSENADDDAESTEGASEKELEKAGLLRAPRPEKHSNWRMGGASSLFGGNNNSWGTSSMAPVQVAAGAGAGALSAATTPAARGASVVSAMVQSFEALRVARAANGYDLLISTKKVADAGVSGQRLRNPPNPSVVSPPSAVSSSPSPSRQLRAAESAPDSLSVSKSRVATTATARTTAPALALALGPVQRQQPLSDWPIRAAPNIQDNDPPKSPPKKSVPTSTTAAPNAARPVDLRRLLSLSSSPDAPPTVATAETGLVRPTPVNSPPQTPRLALDPESAICHPAIVRTSSTASLTLRHPTPDPNKRSRSGAYLGNIAALEATAERLSMTSSIEVAIREEHNELKRSDSRRSSILRASSTGSGRKASASDAGSVVGTGHLSVISRQSSIVGLNTAARLGGYSPGGYIMSPQPSVPGAPARLRSGSKSSSIGSPPVAENVEAGGPSRTELGEGDEFPFLSRHGPGKMSTHSVRSNLSYVQSAELEEPTALNGDALDAADRAATSGLDLDDDETIRASAYQHIEAQFADDDDDDQFHVTQPMLAHGCEDQPTPRLQLHQPGMYTPYRVPQPHDVHGDDRPMTAASVATYDQAQTAFGDFDGVHCVPEANEIHDFPPPPEPVFPQDAPRPQELPPSRPKSYFDPATGQQMLYYPAPVPAMLNLPPKLSKKPKAAARQMRRSQAVVNAMPQESRESRIWLPDPMEGVRGSQVNLPFMSDVLGDNLGPAPTNLEPMTQEQGAEGEDRAHLRPQHSRQASETSTIHPAAAQQPTAAPATAGREIRRPQRLTDGAEKHKSRATLLEGLPPQLRASAFFELPSTAPKIEMKGGSAMATLDSILDASASAPVSAFTDHVFAGKLGSEIYGPEKKKKKKKKNKAGNLRSSTMMNESTPDLLAPGSSKKGGSHFSLLGGRRKQADGEDSDEEWTSVRLGNEDERGAKHPNRESSSPNALAPGSDEETDEEDTEGEEEDEEEDLYQGPPTTLLAELQLRKQQNKMRTRNITQAYPNGMHSTLLELDAVAEVQRKARHGKRINLAWEDPAANPDHTDDLNDDDVPLGMLYVAKANGMNRSTVDISTLMSEVNRPLGLMERRELEDNEPLSRRRDRLQGNQSGLITPTLDVMHQRLSNLNPSPYGNLGLRSQSRLALPLPSPGPGSVAGDFRNGADAGEEGEPEDETLAARKARLAAENPLPWARPVSGLFSSELLSHFGGDDEQRPTSMDSKGKGNLSANAPGKENTPPGTTADVPEEEETLGQRRRRLQAEREAREREMGSGAPALTPMAALAANTLHPVVPGAEDDRVSRRFSMADVLGAHPLELARGAIDPREEERRRREAELARAQADRDARMAMLRAQMPASLPMTSTGAPNGGYMGGKFNDGLGGVPGAGGLGLGYPGSAQQPRMNTMVPPGAYGMGMGYPSPAGMGVGGAPYGGGMPMNMNANMGMNMNPAGGPAYSGYGAPLPLTGQGTDMVERWRQSVMP